MGPGRKLSVVAILFAVFIGVSGGYFAVAGEQIQETQRTVPDAPDTATPQANSSANPDEPAVETIAAPRQLTVVRTNHSARRAVDLSAGESTTVPVSVTATEPLSDVRITTTDPQGLTVTSEPVVVEDLDANESVSYRFTVRADQSVSRTLNVVVRATREGGSVSQRISYPVDALEDGDGTQSDAVQAGSFTAAGTPTTTESTDGRSFAASSAEITVSGQAAYTDPTGRVHGLSDVRVELYDVDGDETRLARTTTAGNGEFTFRLDPGDDADGDGTVRATVVIYAENDAAYVSDGSDVYGFVAETSSLGGGDAVTLGTDVDGDGSKELVASGDNAPFQAVDWAYDAYEFGTDGSLSGEQVPIQYPVGDWAYFEYQTDGEQRIKLPERGYYPWGQQTIYHEYGHSIFFQLRDFSVVDTERYPCHVYVSETDPGYALVEGFAAYYAAAVADDPNAVSWGAQNIEHNQFYDTAYSGECADGDADGEYDGHAVEGSAASIFWDITDGGSDDDDPISYRFATIAETLRSEPDSMAEFREEWRGGDEAALDEVYTTYGIDRRPPTIAYTVDDSPYTDSDVRFSGTVDDEREVTTLELRVNDGPYRSIENDDGRWSVTRTLPDGTSTVTVRASDPDGFTQETTKTVRVSSSAPSASITDVRTAGSESSGPTLQVDFTYAARYPDTATVRMLRDDETVATTSLSNPDDAASGTDASASVTRTLPDGTYTVELVVTDEAGRTATDRDTATLRTAPPPTIAGGVANESGAGLSDVTVRLYNSSDTDFSEPLGTTRTDAAGNYTLSTADGDALRRGESYSVRVSADGATANRTVGPLESGENDGDLVVTTAGAVVLSDLEPESTYVADDVRPSISTNATNTGATTRTASVVLRVNGTAVETQTLTLAGGETRTVTFDDVYDAISELDSGEYTYAVAADDSRQTGTLTFDSATGGGSSVTESYDTNENGVIEFGELSAAAIDYANDDLSFRELSDVAVAYSA